MQELYKKIVRQLSYRPANIENKIADPRKNGWPKALCIYKVTIGDTIPRVILKGVNNFTIKNNMKIAGAVKLTSCNNCPDVPANAPPLYKEETQ